MMVPMDGDIEGVFVGVFVGAVLELAEILMEFRELTELVAVSGKTGIEDAIDVLELVNGIGGIHMLLGWSGTSEVTEIGKSPVELDRTEVVGVRVEVEDSEITVDVELGVDIMVS